eukprot:29426-Pelagococcus_subviridis.AAC.3
MRQLLVRPERQVEVRHRPAAHALRAPRVPARAHVHDLDEYTLVLVPTPGVFELVDAGRERLGRVRRARQRRIPAAAGVSANGVARWDAPPARVQRVRRRLGLGLGFRVHSARSARRSVERRDGRRKGNERTRLVKRRRRRVLLVVHARLLVVPHDRPGDASNLVTRPARPLVQPQIEVRDRGDGVDRVREVLDGLRAGALVHEPAPVASAQGRQGFRVQGRGAGEDAGAGSKRAESAAERDDAGRERMKTGRERTRAPPCKSPNSWSNVSFQRVGASKYVARPRSHAPLTYSGESMLSAISSSYDVTSGGRSGAGAGAGAGAGENASRAANASSSSSAGSRSDGGAGDDDAASIATTRVRRRWIAHRRRPRMTTARRGAGRARE